MVFLLNFRIKCTFFCFLSFKNFFLKLSHCSSLEKSHFIDVFLESRVDV
ncbi:hypothetical protein GJA_2742 [Janthinobacterium agaricidamnosum NBRC 102515 = DSM 9628]|uniref:Uncharacterized protein n=1 Tax=Janthinobacterium agaricidamnosum NBRC 102515 = DSM 9628 TaxID=1349767 RepID=W0V7Q0_9BURK|nr:hypothetical protein GJA_2742 [Janthinobacterium agaricidamnosum NBRC 102515 = DSM 9628]